MSSRARRLVRFGIVLPVAVWVAAMATFFVVAALLPKPTNEATGMVTVLNMLGIFVALFFVVGLLVFAAVAIASLRTLYIGRREPITGAERASAICGLVVSLLFFSVAGYLFGIRSWDINL